MKFPFRKHYSDEKTIEILSQGTEEEENVLEYLYETHYRSVQQMIISRGGQKSDAPDIFQDAIIAFYENVKAKKFQLSSSIKAYLFIIAQNIWITKQKKAGKIISTGSTEELEAFSNKTVHLVSPPKELSPIVDQIMQELKPDCRLILQLSIYNKMSMKAIAKKMGFKNEQVARNKKNKCLNYLRKILHENPKYERVLKTLLEKDY